MLARCRSCVCVRPSDTSRCSTETAKRRITQTTPHDSSGTLVFWGWRSLQNKRVIPNGGAKCRWGRLKLASFGRKFVTLSVPLCTRVRQRQLIFVTFTAPKAAQKGAWTDIFKHNSHRGVQRCRGTGNLGISLVYRRHVLILTLSLTDYETITIQKHTIPFWVQILQHELSTNLSTKHLITPTHKQWTLTLRSVRPSVCLSHASSSERRVLELYGC